MPLFKLVQAAARNSSMLYPQSSKDKSVSEKSYTEELDRIKTNRDLRNDEELSLICDIEKMKRTSYLKVVRVKEKLKLQIDSLSFF